MDVQSIAYLRTPLVNEFSNVTIGAIPYVVVCPLSTNLLLDLKCLKSTGKLTPVLAPWHGGAV